MFTVRGQVHQEPGIAAVPAAGDTTARGTWGAGLYTHDGDGNVCRRKLLNAKDQAPASKNCPPTAKPHPQRPQQASRLQEASSTPQIDCTTIAGEPVYPRRSHKASQGNGQGPDGLLK